MCLGDPWGSSSHVQRQGVPNPVSPKYITLKSTDAKSVFVCLASYARPSTPEFLSLVIQERGQTDTENPLSTLATSREV